MRRLTEGLSRSDLHDHLSPRRPFGMVGGSVVDRAIRSIQ
jgi:hypothetical protein